MKKILAVFCIVFSCKSFSQNLVPNPNFEIFDTCPNGQNLVHYCSGWNSFRGTPDYLNSCDITFGYSTPNNVFGSQNAYDGQAYCGLYTHVGISDSREFIGRQLQTPLVINQKYFVQLKASLAENSDCYTNKLGVTFSNIGFNEANPFPIGNYSKIFSLIMISDTLNWINIEGSFIADSAYNYVIIGNFFDDANTSASISTSCNAYYYVDDICVATDSLICSSIGIKNNYFSPDIVNICPNPSSGKITVHTYIQNLQITIFDLLGNNLKKIYCAGNTEIDISDFSTGIYFIEINYRNKNYYKKQIIIH